MDKTSTSQQRHPADHRVRPNPRKRQEIRAETLEDSSEESLLELRITRVSHSICYHLIKLNTTAHFLLQHFEKSINLSIFRNFEAKSFNK